MMMMSPNAAFKTMEEDDDDIVVPDPITSADATLYAASTDLQEEKKQEDDDRGWLKTIDSWTCYECHVDELTSKTAVTLLPCGHVLCLHCMIDRQATLRNHESSSNGVSGAFTCYCNQVVTSHSYEKQRRRSGPATTREVIMKSLSPQPKMRLHHDEITFIYDSTTAMDDDANMKKDCETKKKSNNSVLNLLCHMMKKIDHFFHAPIGRNGCYIGGYMRILFATIFLYDRILMHYQYDFYYHPNTGVLSQLPNSNSVSSIENLHTLSLFTWLPRITYIDDATLVWILHITGIVQGVLLLLGIMPKFQAICIYLNIVSFQHRGTNMMYDKQDVLCIALSFYMCFLPLNYVSLPQYLWQKNRRVEEDESDEKFQQPIWPFRFFQLQMMFVFWGAGFGKLLHGIGDDEHNYPTSGIWRRGIAMYYVVHEEDFFGGLFAPDFLYNTKFALEILTYASLVLECTCWFFIWPTTTRKFFLYNMILFHLGIDLAMNIHTFQWYSILGWLAFLVVPLDVELNLEDGSSSPPPSSTISSKPKGLSWWSSFKRLITTCCMLSYIVSYTADTFPATYFYNCLPRLFYPAIAKVDNLQNTVSKFTRKYFLLGYLGIEQEYWDMYGTVDPRQTRIVAKVTFTNGKSTYWSQPQWTLLDVWTKKMIYRQVLYFKSMRVRWDDHEEKVYQRALCRHIAGNIGDDAGSEVESVILKALFVKTPTTHYKDMKWYETARQARYIDHHERLLYVYKSKNYDRDDSVDDDEGIDLDDPEQFEIYNYEHAWDEDGIWWDKKFYMYNERTKEYTITDYKWDDYFVTSGVTMDERKDTETTSSTASAARGAKEELVTASLTSTGAATVGGSVVTTPVDGQDEL